MLIAGLFRNGCVMRTLAFQGTKRRRQQVHGPPALPGSEGSPTQHAARQVVGPSRIAGQRPLDAENLSDEGFNMGFKTPPRINYDRQLILVFDEDLLSTGAALQSKWVQRQRGADTSLVHQWKSTVFLNDLLQQNINGGFQKLTVHSRLYLVGHGMVDDDGKVPKFSRQWEFTPKALAAEVKKALRLCQTDKVKRISLFACFGGSTSETRKGQTTESYAEKFAAEAAGLCNEVSAYMDTVNITYESPGYTNVQKATGLGANKAHRGANRKAIFFSSGFSFITPPRVDAPPKGQTWPR